MKALRKFIGLILVLTVLAAALALPASAAATNAEGNPGKVVTVSFTYSNIYSIDGELSYTNKDLMSNIAISNTKEMVGSINGNKVFFYSTDANPANLTITFTVTLAATAQPGDTCSVSFKYETADKNGIMSDFTTETATITVVAEGGGNEGGGNEGGGTEGGGNEGGGNEGGGSQGGGSQGGGSQGGGSQGGGSQGGGSSTVIDYKELLHQISVAEGLNKADYTTASWNNLQTALKSARALKTSKSQSKVDAGAKALADAIAKLVLMDYAKLLENIDTAAAFIEGDEIGTKWIELYHKMIAAKDLLTSGDQAAVDAAAAELSQLYLEIQELIKQFIADNKVTVEVPVEVPVDKLPGDPFCNKPVHKLWHILLIISVFLNLAFVALVVTYVMRKKKNQQDETPLVDYDIEDDQV